MSEFKTKEETKEYIVITDPDGKKSVKVVTTTVKWFEDSDSRHNPTVSTSTEFLL